MAYSPSLADLPNQQSSGYTPSLSDLPSESGPGIPTREESLKSIAGLTAGLSNFGASTGESAIDAGLWIANKLGLSDKKFEAMKSAAHQGANEFRTQGNPNGDIFEQGVAEHPVMSAAAQYVPSAIALTKLTPGNIIPGSSTAATLGNMAIKAGANIISGAGISGPNTHQQNMGAVIAGVLSPVADLVTMGISKAASHFQLGQKLAEYTQPAIDKIKNIAGLDVTDQAMQAEAATTKNALDIDTANFNKLKKIPGTIETKELQDKSLNLLESRGSVNTGSDTMPVFNHDQSTLDTAQQKILQNIHFDAGKVDDMEKAIQLRSYISDNKSAFQGKGVTKPVMNMYNDLLSTIDNQIEGKAEDAGLKGAYQAAKDFHSKVVAPLRDSGAMDRLSAVKEKAGIDAYRSQNPNIQVPESANYAESAKTIFPANMTVQQYKTIESRLGPDGKQIMQNKLLSDVFKENLSDPSAINKDKLLVKANQYLKKYDSVLSDESKQTVKGLITTLKEGGAGAGSGHPGNSAYFQHYTGHAIGNILGGTLGGYEGYQHGGLTGGVVGSALGIYAMPRLLEGIGASFKGLLETPAGQRILREIAKNPQIIREGLQPGVQAIPALLSNKNQQNQ